MTQSNPIHDIQAMHPYEEMLAYETLLALKGIKPKDLKEQFKQLTPSEVLKNLGSQFELDSNLPQNNEEDLKKKVEEFFKTELKDVLPTISVSVNRSFQYPPILNNTTFPVGLFYYKGDLGLLETRRISIVGARKAKEKGIKKAKELSRDLSKEGFTIVSGLAQGIDTVAHNSSIDSGGNTIAVIGTPINQYYPKENRKLQDKIARDFLLISHVPFYKYSKEPFSHHKFHFPKRNHVMACISEATVIVEASDTSGTLTQARECLKQGKTLFILDSCFQDPKIKWPKRYLDEKRAFRVKNASDILENLDPINKL